MSGTDLVYAATSRQRRMGSVLPSPIVLSSHCDTNLAYQPTRIPRPNSAGPVLRASEPCILPRLAPAPQTAEACCTKLAQTYHIWYHPSGDASVSGTSSGLRLACSATVTLYAYVLAIRTPVTRVNEPLLGIVNGKHPLKTVRYRLRAGYALSGTGTTYGGMRCLHMVLSAYKLSASGTARKYAATDLIMSSSMSGIALVYAATCLRACYTMSGTDGAMLLPGSWLPSVPTSTRICPVS
eukprot:3940877-Rhodomonas_salina.4